MLVLVVMTGGLHDDGSAVMVQQRVGAATRPSQHGLKRQRGGNRLVFVSSKGFSIQMAYQSL
jgi:hypothetical protein